MHAQPAYILPLEPHSDCNNADRPSCRKGEARSRRRSELGNIQPRAESCESAEIRLRKIF